MRVRACTFREYMTVRHEKTIFWHLLGVAVSRGAVSAIMHYLPKRENKVRVKPVFLLKRMSICSCSVMAWLCQRRSVCEQPLRCCRWWGVSSPIPWAQQCWDVAAQAGSRHAASRSGLGGRVLLHTETRQVLVVAWDFDLGPQSWQETVAFASSLTPGQ